MTPTEVKEMLKQAFPGDSLQVRDMTGTGDHFDIVVISKKFKGKTRIEQHQMVHRALEKEMDRGIHAVRIKTQEEC